AQAQIEKQTLLLAILRHQDDARPRGLARRMESRRLIADAHRSRLGTLETDNRLEQLGASGADQAEETDNFTGADSKRHAFEAGPARQAIHLQAGVARDARCSGPGPAGALRNGAADHRLDDLVGRHRVALEGADVAAVAQRGDAIAQPE